MTEFWYCWHLLDVGDIMAKSVSDTSNPRHPVSKIFLRKLPIWVDSPEDRYRNSNTVHFHIKGFYLSHSNFQFRIMVCLTLESIFFKWNYFEKVEHEIVVHSLIEKVHSLIEKVFSLQKTGSQTHFGERMEWQMSQNISRKNENSLDYCVQLRTAIWSCLNYHHLPCLSIFFIFCNRRTRTFSMII